MGLPAESIEVDRRRTHLWVTFERESRVVGRTVSSSGRVRWGPGLGIEFSYPVPGIDVPEELFRQGKEGAQLLLREDMVGEISTGTTTIPIEELGGLGLLQTRKGRRFVQLTSRMEGRLEYRGLVVRFKYGPPLRKESAPKLGGVPLRFRRGIVSLEELPFFLLAAAVYFLLFMYASHLASMPLPAEPAHEEVAKRFAKLIYEAPRPKVKPAVEKLERQRDVSGEEATETVEAEEPSEPVAEASPAEETTSEAAPESPPPVAQPEEATGQVAVAPAETAEPNAGGGGKGPDSSLVRREEIRKKVANKGLLGLLGGRGAASTAATPGGALIASSRAMDNLDEVLEKVDGLRSGTAPSGSGEGDGVGDGDGDGIGEGLANGIDTAAMVVASATHRKVELEERKDEAVEVAEEDVLDEITVREAVAAIHKAVTAYLGSIRYLYNRELRKRPDLEGKLTVSITVSPEGSVTECHVVSSTLDAPSLEKAILGRILKWKLPQVAPKPLTVTYPFVFFPSM